MAFDRTDPTDLAELKSEVTTDPNGYGYDPANTTLVLEIINQIRATITIEKERISSAHVRGSTTFEAYDGLLVDRQEWLRWMTGSNGFQEENLDVTADLKLQLAGIGGQSLWAVGERAAMEAAMLALINRDGTRAEELWGIDTTITRDDWIAARDS